MLLDRISERSFDYLVVNLFLTKNILDPESVRLSAVKNLLLFLREKGSDRIGLMESIMLRILDRNRIIDKLDEIRENILQYPRKTLSEKKYISFRMCQWFGQINGNDNIIEFLSARLDDFVMLLLDLRIDNLKNVVRGVEYLRNNYFLKWNEINVLPFFLNENDVKTYNIEIVKQIIDRNIGWEEINKRVRENDDKERRAREIKRQFYEKKINEKQIRHQTVLDLLNSNGYFYEPNNFWAVEYIDGRVELDERKILEKAKENFDKIRKRDEKNYYLEKELEKYGINNSIYGNLYNNYINTDQYTLQEIVDKVREKDFLKKYTKFSTMTIDSIIYYDQLLQERVRIRKYKMVGIYEYGISDKDTNDLKSYALERYMETRNWNIDDGTLPPLILERMKDIIARRDENMLMEIKIAERRAKKKEENLLRPKVKK